MRAPIRLATGGLLGRPVVFSDQSMQRLSGVNPALVDVLKETERRALQQGIKIEVSEGLRNRERQAGLVKAGKSQTMNSRHITGDAVDIFIKNPDGTANWDFEAYRPVADIAKQVAAERGVPDLVWGGDWRTLKDGVHFQVGKSNMPQTRMAGSAQGGQTVQRSTMNAPPGLLGGSEPKPSFWDKIPGGLLSDPDRRARLAMAFEGMTLNPNQALIGALSEDVKDRRQTKAQEKAMNATVEWLKSQGRDDLAAAVSSGALTGSQAAQMAYQRPDPMEALNVERAQLEIEALRNPQPDMTSAQREYQMAQQQGFQGSFLDYQNALAAARRPETNITTNVDAGAGGKFEEAFAKGDADTINTVYTAGLQAQRNLGRIDQLDALLKAAPTGAMGSIKQAAGEFGINTEGLSDIQAAQALINSLVPEQRQPGSGPMSDADLALFKQSLPRIINQPGGNETIIQTMRAIAQYDAQGAQIVQQLREGQITRAQAFEALQARENPLDNFRAATGVTATPTQPSAPVRRRYNPETGALE